MRGNQIKIFQKCRFLDFTFKLKKISKKSLKKSQKNFNFYLKKFYIFRIKNLNQEIAIFVKIFLSSFLDVATLHLAKPRIVRLK